ncbi:MAG: M36 family metallopeptidase, partial [Deltaproteobacteria bacterium]|nr:M36 family metallopeptidase [Deltaproteobacteria bacterium]
RPTGGGGTLAVYRQRVDGVEVLDTRVSLLLDGRGRLRAAGGQLHGAAGRPYAFAHGPASAVTTALADCWGHRGPGESLVSPSPIARRHQVDLYFVPTAAARASGYALDRPARARRVLFPMPTRLVPATYVELWVTEAARGPILVAYVVSAEDQSVLHRRLLTDEESFSYTVFADTGAPFLPVDGPFGDVTPDAAGMPVDALPSYVGQAVVTMEGFNTNPVGAADPWLPIGATESRGNNVDAYADLSSPDGFSAGDRRASTTAPTTFGHVFDPMREPDADATQQSAVVTQLFYVNNWLHDYFYDVGFTEAAGNAQEDNFGRGGEAGDPLWVESMDYGGTNNANMSTPVDGSSPRMQMFLWRGKSDARVEAGGASYDVGVALWGPTVFDETAPTALVDDGVATLTDACEAIATDLTGQLALIDRGNCTFGVKVRNAQVAGAVGAIVMNNRAGGTTTMSGTPPGPVTIPALFVSQGDGAVLRGAALGMATRMLRAPSVPRPDSSLDATVVVHEWGHYLHNRLVNGTSRQRRAMGEGWGDLLALVMLARPSDDFAGAHPHAGFSNQGREFIYFGTRRVPYSTNRALNDLSFRHISVGELLPTLHPLDATSSNNAEVHNAGEVWATLMFEAFASLADRSREATSPYSFEQMRARFAAYVVLGMQLAPRNPTYTEQRDAFLAAALDTDLEDARRIALAFARRGAGTCAEAPSRASTDLVGVVEDFTVGAAGALDGFAVEADGPGRLCDADGLLDGGENGLVRVAVQNTGLIAFSDAVVVVGAGDPGVTFPAGSVWPVSDLGPGESEEFSVPIDVSEAAAIADHVVVSATLSAPAFCDDVLHEERVPMDRDEAPSTLETFEVFPEWLRESSLDGTSVGVWSVGPSTLGGVSETLRAIDTASLTDTAVQLPEVTASATESLVLSFEHRFDFEASDTVLWDGGVVEVSTDGGGTWVDVDGYVDPGYTGALSDRASSPLSLRPAYSRTNPSAPASDLVSLDFGTAFAAMPVRFRFRVGTDESTGGPGWEIDEVSITGGDPAPFTAFEADTAECADAPVADAGPDVEVFSGELFALDAAGSFDPNDDPLTFSWEQVSGEPLFDLTTAATDTPELRAPSVDGPTDFELRVRVSDGAASSTDDVRVRVLLALPPADAGTTVFDTGTMPGDGGAGRDAETDAETDAGLRVMGGGGCSCRATTSPADRGLGRLWLLGAMMAALRLRRRVSRDSSPAE